MIIDAQMLFWISVVLLFYTYFGYPALLWVWAMLFPRGHRTESAEPTTSVVVAAYNEALWIEAKLDNLLTQDYPRERMEIIVASDGSTDDTVARAGKYREHGVRVVDFDVRRGKPSVLNSVVAGARGEIVVLADARQRFHPGAVRALVRHFADPGVGAVSGELILTSDNDACSVSEGVSFYWKYEKFMRRYESLVDSTAGATGAIYALRRELFEPIPDDTLLDDVLIPMRMVRRGFRVLFDPAAVAYDRAAATPGTEFSRKVRTIAGNVQLFGREWWLLNPFRNRIWLQTVSHKAFRLISPIALGTAFVTNVMLLEQPLFQWSLAGQAIFYGAAMVGLIARSASRSHFVFNVPYAFCVLNCAAAVALVRMIRGRQQVTWSKGSG